MISPTEENLVLLQDIERYYNPKENYDVLVNNGFLIQTSDLNRIKNYITYTYNDSMLLLVTSYLKLKYLASHYNYFNVLINVNVKLANSTISNYIDANGYFNEDTIVLTRININIPIGVKKRNYRDDLVDFKKLIDTLCNYIEKFEFKNANLFWMTVMGLFEPDIIFDYNHPTQNSYKKIPIFLIFQNVDMMKNEKDVIIGSTSSYECLVAKQNEYYKTAKVNREQYNKYIAPTIFRPNITFITLGNNTFLIYWFIDTASKTLSNIVSNIFLDSDNIYSYQDNEDYLSRVAHLQTEKLAICTQVIPVISNGVIDTTKLSCILAFGKTINFENASAIAKNALNKVYSNPSAMI